MLRRNGRGMMFLATVVCQGSLYFSFREAVGVFRGLVGAPDTPQWNSVLFGGKL